MKKLSLKTIFIFAMTLRVGIALIMYFYSLLKGNGGFYSFAPDAEYYHYAGRMIASYWHGNTYNLGVPIANYYVYFIAAIYYVFGPVEIIPIFINILLNCLLVIIIYFVVNMLSDNNSAKLAAVIIGTWPSMALFSTQILKDSLIIFLIYLIIYSFIKIQKQMKPNLFIVIFALSVYFLTLLRWYIAVFLFIALIGSILYNIFFLKQKINYRYLGYLTLIVFILNLNYLYSFLTVKQTIHNLNNYRNNVYAIGDSALPKYDIENPFSMFKAIVAGLVNFLFRPFPRDLQDKSIIMQLLIPLEMIIWYILTGLFFFRIKEYYKDINLVFIFVFLLTVMAVYSLVIANVGAMYRLREQVIPAVVALVAHSYGKLFLDLRSGERNE